MVRTLMLVLTLAWAALPPPARADDPPSEPLLRVETGMHTAMIKRIDVDAAGRRLLTVSDDKTARLWSLPDGRPIRVFRPPIAPGNEGKLYAGALSPDGRTVAVGGWTGYDLDGEVSVYLFDAERGTLTRRLTGLPNVIHHLVFSRDGRRLAAGVGEKGVRVWDVANGREVLADRDYGDSVYGLSFAADGRLATTSYDGHLRLYDRDGTLLRKVKAPGGERPYDIVFSPDATRLAVGYEDIKRVSVLSASDLSLLYSPDTTGGGRR